MYCGADMMTDEDKEATIKNARVLLSDEPFVGTCKMKSAQWRERRVGPSEGVGGQAGTWQADENKMGGVVFFAGKLKIICFPTKHK